MDLRNTRHQGADRTRIDGQLHTDSNSIEGVWSLFKPSIIGSFHKMNEKHMDRYLEELEWRFNNRNNPHIFRDTLVSRHAGA